jgi:hypothetical protein
MRHPVTFGRQVDTLDIGSPVSHRTALAGASTTIGAMPIHLSRQELYDRVWAAPIQKLSSEFGLSDVGLAKLCRRYNIPVPPRAYWAKKQAGKRVQQPRWRLRGCRGYGQRDEQDTCKRRFH